MPKNATLDQRVKWHLEHVVECGCRAIPKTMIAELKARGVAIPQGRR